MSVLFGLTPAQEIERDRERRAAKTGNNSMLERTDGGRGVFLDPS